MPGLKPALVLVAVILFLLAAGGVPTGRVSVGWLGLAFLAASEVVS